MTKKKKKRDVDTLVVKHNTLIEGRYQLSLPQMRMFLLMISQVRRDDKTLKRYRMYISDLVKLEEEDKYISLRHEYDTCEKITDGLQKTLIKIEKEKGVLISIQLLGKVKYYKGKGYFDYYFDEDIKDLLLNLKERFTSFDVRNILPCKSVYSIRIYELLKSFEGLKERQIKLEDLKSYLGIEKGKYKLYGDIKRYILKNSQKELKKYSDLYFDFVEIKKGKKVDGIKFIIKRQKQTRFDFDPKEETKYIDIEELTKQQDKTYGKVEVSDTYKKLKDEWLREGEE